MTVRLGTALLAAVLITVVPVLAACGTDEDGPPDDKKCEWLGESRGGDDAGRVAILVDASSSTRSASGTGSVDYPAALRDEIDRIVEAQQPVAISAFSGPSGDVSLVERVPNWKAQANNDSNRQAKKAEARTCIEADILNAQRATPTPGGTDVLRAVTQASAWLREQTGAARKLVVASDGLVTTGCANLVGAQFRGQDRIKAIVDLCAEGELKENTLTDVAVTMIGVGYPAADQPLPETAQATWLRNLWRELCKRGGGTAAIAEQTVRRVESAGTAPAAAGNAPDPTIEFSDVDTRSVPGAALFDTGEATLKPEAGPLLTEIAARLRSKQYQSIAVLGYADPRGGAGVDNQQLSEDRARAVAEALIAEGVRTPAPQSKGMGTTSTCFDGRTIPQGTTSEAELACLRRVDIAAK